MQTQSDEKRFLDKLKNTKFEDLNLDNTMTDDLKNRTVRDASRRITVDHYNNSNLEFKKQVVLEILGSSYLMATILDDNSGVSYAQKDSIIADAIDNLANAIVTKTVN